MSLRRWLRSLERSARGEMIAIAQTDDAVKYFPQSALQEAFLRNCEILYAKMDGREPPPPTELQLAIANAARPERWHDAYADALEDIGPVPDLSEP